MVLTSFEGMEPEPAAEGLTGFYYDQLPEELQSVYGQLYTGIAAHKSEIYIEMGEMRSVAAAVKAIRILFRLRSRQNRSEKRIIPICA